MPVVLSKLENKKPERALKPTSKSRKYPSFLVELGQKLKKDDLDELKFVLKYDIPEGKLENLDRPIQVFRALENRGKLGPDKLDDLRECLDAIGRADLVDLLEEYEDADSKFPLKPRSDNRLEKDGYSVSVIGGRHFETTEGECVEVRSGSTYSLTLVNNNNHRCTVYILIDGYEMFPNGFLLLPNCTSKIERPSRIAKRLKFFAIVDAPLGSGINKFRKEENGLIQVKFYPEKADMKITCVASGSKSHVLSCSTGITDTEFLAMVSSVFGKTVATVIINKWKPLGKRGVKLVDYGVGDGSRVDVNVGMVGGTDLKECVRSKKNTKWRAGASALEEESDQEFGLAKAFAIDRSQVATLNLRLYARENEIPLPSTGNPTPLTRATLIPPPAPI